MAEIQEKDYLDKVGLGVLVEEIKGADDAVLAATKKYTDDEIDKIESTAEGLDGRLTTVEGAVEVLNGEATVDGSLKKVAKDAADAVDAEKTRAEGVEGGLQNAIDAINNAETGIEAVAKKYTDDEIDKVEATIGTVAEGETVVSMIADAKKAGTDANTALETYKTTNDAAVSAAQAAADAAQDDVDALEEVVGDMTAVKTTAKVIAEAIDELKDAIDSAVEAGEIELTTAETATEGYLKTYVLTQGETEIGKIDIPKDLVVKSGSVVVDPEGQEKGTYIELIIANDEETPIYINVKNLVDIYKGAEGATQVQIAVDGYTISATLVAGGVGTTELADSAVTTAKIADLNVTKAKLAADVQATLDKADAAEQAIADAIDALDSTKSQTAGADGLALEVVEEDGKITSISGSIAANTYDAYGAASTAQAAAEKVATDFNTAMNTRVEALESVNYVAIAEADIRKMFE